MTSTATAAWSVTGLAAASVVALTLGMGLQGGAAATPLGTSVPLVAASPAPNGDAARPATATARPNAAPSAGAGEDLSGPCDEAEHVGDPRCAGVRPAPAAAREAGEDISGPCDEVEHATDPRCSGAVTGEPLRGGTRAGDRRVSATTAATATGDRTISRSPSRLSSGRGSGRESSSGRDSSSGPGSGDDDSGSGHSGSGSGHDDSGHDED